MDLIDYTRYGECSSCGQCCSDILHLSEEEIKRIDKYLKENKVIQHNKGKSNLCCPFRNEMLKKCDIYEVRPEICRIFKCNKTPEEAYRNREFTNFNKKPRSLAELFFKDDSKIKFLREIIPIKIFKRGE